MKPQHSSQNEPKPLNHNHQPQMLSVNDSKTHYQSKFSSSDQTSSASYNNIDAIRAWPICGTMFGVVVTWKPCLPGPQITFPSPPPLNGSSLPQEDNSIFTVFTPLNCH